MKFCSNCGDKIREDIINCSSCGSDLTVAPSDSRHFDFAMLSFFMPIIGFILWVTLRNEYPLRTKSIKKGIFFNLLILLGFILIAGYLADKSNIDLQKEIFRLISSGLDTISNFLKLFT